VTTSNPLFTYCRFFLNVVNLKSVFSEKMSGPAGKILVWGQGREHVNNEKAIG
jgi:hypothetical protein